MVLTWEALIVISTVLFPPVLTIISITLLLASFGTSLGLRERYVNFLIHLFEWSARQIESTQEMERRGSRIFYSQSDDSEVEVELEDVEDAHMFDDAYQRRETADDLDSGIAINSPTIRSNASSTSLAHRRQESNASLASSASARVRHASGQSSIIARETALHLDDMDDILTERTYVKSRGWAVVEDSLYFAKAGIEAIIEDEVTSRFSAEQLSSWNMMTRNSVQFYQYIK